MKISDIFDRIILRSGQFILNKRSIELDVDSFRMLVEDALAIYTKASPYVKEYIIEMNDRLFTFTPEFDPELNQVPDWIASATPILGGANPLYSPYGSYGANQTAYSGTSNEPLQALHKYTKPVIGVNFSGKWEIEACFHHKIIETTLPNATKPTYSVPTINITDTVLFELLQGMFLQGIGRSRRAFTLNDIPIAMDADTLASEGEAMIVTAKENLQNIQKIHTLFGV